MSSTLEGPSDHAFGRMTTPFKTPKTRRNLRELNDFINAARCGDYSAVTSSQLDNLQRRASPRRSRDLQKEKEEQDELRRNLLNSREKSHLQMSTDLRQRRHHQNQKQSLAINQAGLNNVLREILNSRFREEAK